MRYSSLDCDHQTAAAGGRTILGRSGSDDQCELGDVTGAKSVVDTFGDSYTGSPASKRFT